MDECSLVSRKSQDLRLSFSVAACKGDRQVFWLLEPAKRHPDELVVLNRGRR